MFVGFDLDGVIIDHTFVKIKIARKFGLTLTEKETHANNIYRLLGMQKYNEFKYYLYDNPVTANSATLVKDSGQTLRFLKENKIPFAVISRRKANYEIPVNTLKILGVWPELLNEGNTFFVPGREHKNTHAIRLGVSHFIDDELKALKMMPGVPNRYLFDPYMSSGECMFVKVVSLRGFCSLIFDKDVL